MQDSRKWWDRTCRADRNAGCRLSRAPGPGPGVHAAPALCEDGGRATPRAFGSGWLAESGRCGEALAEQARSEEGRSAAAGRCGSQGGNGAREKQAFTPPRKAAELAPPAGAGWLPAAPGLFQLPWEPVESGVYLRKGLSMPEGHPAGSGAERVAAASLVAPNCHQNVLWGHQMHVSVNQIIPKCFSFWDIVSL